MAMTELEKQFVSYKGKILTFMSMILFFPGLTMSMILFFPGLTHHQNGAFSIFIHCKRVSFSYNSFSKVYLRLPIYDWSSGSSDIGWSHQYITKKDNALVDPANIK
jgi:hypothetical protein